MKPEPLTPLRITLRSSPPSGRAVFFDRDGVLNANVWRDGRPYAPWTENEIRIEPDAPSIVAAAQAAGYTTFVVSNQPAVGQGVITLHQCLELNASIAKQCGIEHAYLCPHNGDDGCGCRKPNPGMLEQASRDFAVDLSQSWLIGDRWVDILAGQRAGVRTCLVERDYSFEPTKFEHSPSEVTPDVVVAQLADFGRMLRQATPDQSAIPGASKSQAR